MTSGEPRERFRALCSSFTEQDFALLGALACERALPLAVLEKLSPEPALPAGIWLKRKQAEGLIISARPRRTASLKPHFGVRSDYRELVLRELSRRGELEAVARVTHALLGARSLSDLTLALQRGDLDDLQRRFAQRKNAPEFGPSSSFAWLRESVSEPFDARFLADTWGDAAARIAAFALKEAALEPSACVELWQWAKAELPSESGSELASVLYEHAILRGELAETEALLVRLNDRERFSFGVAECFANGDLVGVNARLDRLPAPFAKRGEIPDLGSLSPLIALLLVARDDEPSRSTAKRVLAGVWNRGALRALRILFKHQSEPPEEQRRLDVHQLPEDVTGWEIAILALTVHLYTTDKWARANWCQLLVRRASEWQRAGYAWFARQALFLAQMLNEEHFDSELARLEVPFRPEREARELVLWELFSAKAEWEKTLAALAQISDFVAEDQAQNRRVSWFVDMANGALSRPALQEFRAAEGWSDGRRVTLAELWPFYAELPPEDQRVLDCTHELIDGERHFNADAAEALIGHPRVVNGARARAPVSVVRGTCRLETREDRGYVQVFVEPPGAELGVNVVPEDDRRLAVYRVTPAMERVIGALRGGTRVPKSHERELLTVLAKLSESVEVHSPELGAEQTVHAEPTPCIRFSVHAGAWLVQLGVRPFGERGRFFLAGSGRAGLSFYRDGQRLRCERDLELERAKMQALCRAVPTFGKQVPEGERSPFDAPESFILSEEGALALLSELRDSGERCELEWPESGGLRLSALAHSRHLHGRMRVDKGWYLVTGGVQLDDVNAVTLSELALAPALGQGRFVRLPSGDYVEVEARLRRVVAALKAATVQKGAPKELRLPKSALGSLEELADRDFGLEFDAESNAWLERVKTLKTREFPVPRALTAELRPYQEEGFAWLSYLSELGLGACLADDMGLGKTVQIIALLLARAEQGLGPALVIAPTSVCGNWLIELARFAPTLTALDYAGKDRAARLTELAEAGNGSVVVCSYTLLQQDRAELAKILFGTAVLDEAQFIKNSESLRAQAAFALNAKQRVAATGTPVENHLGDLWSIFQFLNPAMLGDWAHFRRTFVMPVERDGSENATELLRKLVKPFVLRRLKRDVLPSLPAVTEVRHDVTLTGDEALRYGILRKQIHEKLYTVHGRRFNKIEVLAEITRLRRFCCHPSLVFPDAPPEFSKVEAFLDLVEELRENEHRALVFSQFVDFLGIVRERLDELGISYEYLDGSTPQADRQARVAAFQNGTASLFLISLKAGGFGLNLTAADYVIHLDPWWNPAVEAQATDRAHRIGQERPVTVYRLITRETIEDGIVELHRKKRRIAESLLSGGDAVAGVSAEELLGLIEASAD